MVGEARDGTRSEGGAGRSGKSRTSKKEGTLRPGDGLGGAGEAEAEATARSSARRRTGRRRPTQQDRGVEDGEGREDTAADRREDAVVAAEERAEEAEEAAQAARAAAARAALQRRLLGETDAPVPPLARALDSLRNQFKRAVDRLYLGNVLPPIGSYQISYARLLQLLKERRVKRLILIGDGRLAMVEVAVLNTESRFQSMRYDKRSLRAMYAEEVSEVMMEKERYYCQLPGDIWEEGLLMKLVKKNQPQKVLRDGKWVRPNSNVLRINQVRPELELIDPSGSNVLVQRALTDLVPIAALLALRLAVDVIARLVKPKVPKKSEREQMAEKYGAHRAREYNVPPPEGSPAKSGVKVRDTGVRFKDVAGIDAIQADIREVIDILLGDERYISMGAKPFRGIMMEGPPGTGKTLLAKAMAGEGGMPFYSVTGSEFVEMFQGVAAARVRSLFRAARKHAPAVVFIDEIDALGKARDLCGDAGSQEREQGLLQLLTEMDGAVQGDRVLVIGATNRVDQLDPALMRPGRFDRRVYMGLPSRANRLKILQLHATGKPVDRGDDDAALRRLAALTVGYSGAALANLLNEAAILSVRAGGDGLIDLHTLLQARDKIEQGLPHVSLPPSEAKRRLAVAQAARAVALALTPGVPPLKSVSLKPRGAALARIEFEPQALGRDGGTLLALTSAQTFQQADDASLPDNNDDGDAHFHVADQSSLPSNGTRINAVRLDRDVAPFELACGLMVPLYAARCAEETWWGGDAASLATGRELGLASEIARWLVVDSTLHPAYRGGVTLSNLTMGGVADPTTAWMDDQHDDAILALQEAARDRAARLVAERATVIDAVATELYAGEDETISAERIVALLDATPLDSVRGDHDRADGVVDREHADEQALLHDGIPRRVADTDNKSARDTTDHLPGVVAGAGGSRQTTPTPRQRDREALARRVLGARGPDAAQYLALAEVFMGSAESWDFLQRRVLADKAEQAREALATSQGAARVAAVREYVLSGGDAPFPPPPPSPAVPRPSRSVGPRPPADAFTP